ncbi:MAG: YedE family putative selenium transporter [Eggerthellaceae bacterium]|nr:YedE family putative selenium transporter [Eggerthellaceae bacterium]MEE0343524.1 YedE family putative selenium transporter [Eggerthellaceae bacterium]
MNSLTKERVVLVVSGIVAAAVAIMLASNGNPGNMAICIACFIRDSAGAMKLQTNETVQYLRPEIIGIIVGACVMAFIGKEFKATAGSSPFTRFALGFIVMIGCLIFLGCPLRMVLRMAAGDLNAWVALIGFAAGILTGVFFLKKGFSLGRAETVKKGEGLILPIVVVALFILSVTTTVFAVSQSGPGSMHAPVVLSLIGGIAFGMLAQRSRLCFAGGLRDLALVRDGWGLVVIGILFAGVLIFNLVNGSFHLSFTDQPIAHTEALWNILGMYVVGFGVTLLGGCPLRQLVLAGSGSGDSAVTFIGLLVGAAFAHNFGLASSANGTTEAGQIATIVCIVLLFIIAAVNLTRSRA